MSADEAIIKRAMEYGWKPTTQVEEARRFIEERRYRLCEVCDEPLDLEAYPRTYFCSRLMGDPPPIVCHECFVLWYDRGMTDPVKMREERDRQRAASREEKGK